MRSGGTAHECGGCDQSIGSTVSDAIIRSWLWLTATGVSHWAVSVHYWKFLIIDPTFCGSRFHYEAPGYRRLYLYTEFPDGSPYLSKVPMKINLYDPSLLPTLLCSSQCMRHTQKCITATQALLISKLGGWKHTTVFHKSSEANQTLKHLRQY